MITEFMAGLILAGLLLIVIARIRTGRKAAEEERVMGEATGNLKQELERTGSEIIDRMGTHVSRLENLIYEAEEKTGELQGQMAEMGRLQQTIQQQLGEEKSLSAQLNAQLNELSVRQQQIAAMQRQQVALASSPNFMAHQGERLTVTEALARQGYAQETLGFGENMELVDA